MSKSGWKKLFKFMISLTILTFVAAGVGFLCEYFINKTDNTMKSGCLVLEATNFEKLSLASSYPLSNEASKSLKPYTYTIKNTCNVSSYYEVTLNEKNVSNDNKVKVSLDGDSYLAPKLIGELPQTSNIINDSYSSVYLLDTGYIDGGEEKSFDFRMWIDFEAISFKENYEVKLSINTYEKSGPSLKSGTVGYKVYQDYYSKGYLEKSSNGYNFTNNVYIKIGINNDIIFTIKSVNNDGTITINNDIDNVKSYSNQYFIYKNGYLVSLKYVDLVGDGTRDNPYALISNRKVTSIPSITDCYLTSDNIIIIANSDNGVSGYYVSKSDNKNKVNSKEFIESDNTRIVINNNYKKGFYYLYVKDKDGNISNYKKIEIK